MSEPPKFLFDECLGRPITEAIRKLVSFHRHQIGMMHVLERFKAGEHDEVWVPAIAQENWIVVSVDRGKAPGPKLPRLCQELHVRHVLFAPTAAALPQFEKARAFFRVWRDLINFAETSPGACALLKIGAGGPRLDPLPPSPATPTTGLTSSW